MFICFVNTQIVAFGTTINLLAVSMCYHPYKNPGNHGSNGIIPPHSLAPKLVTRALDPIILAFALAASKIQSLSQISKT